MTRDFAAIPAVRNQLAQAEVKAREAAKIARDAGLTDTAEEIMIIFRRMRVLTGKDGWLDWMERG
ncbi:hypothetical protein [Roseovarius amoyensis]|uniref:hypothetical protein n=1 Tax=Roseovarius amoyensis TaxID=2211448 RepID=UPI000DBE11BC|nr:hypothetical protein [Roseovarius amoyensis]